MNAQNIRDYNFTLAANATQNLDVPGDYLKVIGATGAIRVRTVEGWMKDLLPGQGVKGLNFQRLILEDRSGAANVGTIAVGIGADSIVDDRITGTVNVIDNGKSRTLEDNAFLAGASAPGVAANFTHLQFRNNSLNNRAVIKKFVAGGSTMTGPATLQLRWLNTQLTSAFGAGLSKLVGSSTVFGETRTQQNATILGSGLAGFGLPQNGNVIYEFCEPLIVPPGQSVLLVNDQAAAGLSCTFELFIEPV